jgi:hypothetical protein
LHVTKNGHGDHGQICWLFAAVVWGTIKILSTRTNLPQNVVDGESQWTFGQILPLLLLCAPLLSIITTFISGFTERSEAARPGQGETLTHILPNPVEAAGAEIFTRTADPNVVTPKESTTITTTVEKWSDAVDHLRTDYKESWLLPCLAAELGAVSYVVARGFVMLGDGTSFIEGWIQYELLYYVFLGVPLASTFSVAVGLAMDLLPRPSGYERSIAWHLVLFITSSVLHLSYAMAFLKVDYYNKWGLDKSQGVSIGVGFGLTVIIYLLYWLSCLGLEVYGSRMTREDLDATPTRDAGESGQENSSGLF